MVRCPGMLSHPQPYSFQGNGTLAADAVPFPTCFPEGLHQDQQLHGLLSQPAAWPTPSASCKGGCPERVCKQPHHEGTAAAAQTACQIAAGCGSRVPTPSGWMVHATQSSQSESDMPTSWLCHRPRSYRFPSLQQQQDHSQRLQQQEEEVVCQVSLLRSSPQKAQTTPKAAVICQLLAHPASGDGRCAAAELPSTPTMPSAAPASELANPSTDFGDCRGSSPQETTCKWVLPTALPTLPSAATACAESPVPEYSAGACSSETYNRAATPHSWLAQHWQQGLQTTKCKLSAQTGTVQTGAVSSTAIGNRSVPYESDPLYGQEASCSADGHCQQAAISHLAVGPQSAEQWVRHDPQSWHSAAGMRIHRPTPMLPGTAIAWTQTDTRLSNPLHGRPTQLLHPVLQAHVDSLAVLNAQPVVLTAEQLVGGLVTGHQPGPCTSQNLPPSNSYSRSPLQTLPAVRSYPVSSPVGTLPHMSNWKGSPRTGLHASMQHPGLESVWDPSQQDGAPPGQMVCGSVASCSSQPAWLPSRMQASLDGSHTFTSCPLDHFPVQGCHTSGNAAMQLCNAQESHCLTSPHSFETSRPATGPGWSAAVASTNTIAHIKVLRQLQKQNQVQQQLELNGQQQTLQLLQQQLMQQMRQHETATLQLQQQLSMLHGSHMANVLPGHQAFALPTAATSAAAARQVCSDDVSDSERQQLRLMHQPAWDEDQMCVQQISEQQASEQSPGKHSGQSAKKPRHKRPRAQGPLQSKKQGFILPVQGTQTPMCSLLRPEVSPSGSSNGGGRGSLAHMDLLLLPGTSELSSKQQALLSRILTGSVCSSGTGRG